MKFEEMLRGVRLLDRLMKIRRKEWDENIYMDYSRSEMLLYFVNPKTPIDMLPNYLLLVDINADDWEIELID